MPLNTNKNKTRKMKGGKGTQCPCMVVPPIPGESIGFTMRSSLKAKGLIPRANGTKRVSLKYR